MPRPRGKKPAIRLSISLDPADHAELLRLCEQHDLSLAWMIRKAVGEFVERHGERQQLPLPLKRTSGNGEAA